MRAAFYPPLAHAANRWAQRLGQDEHYPDELEAFLDRCHDAGQTRPTPLIFRYGVGDWNALHQDIFATRHRPVRGTRGLLPHRDPARRQHGDRGAAYHLRHHLPRRRLMSVPSLNMSTLSLRELRNNLGTVVRDVAYTGYETIITDNGREVAVIISLDDYERLHEHADVADALRLRDMRATGFATMSLDEMLTELGVSLEDFAEQAV